jgi:dienelactone hydrolase
MKIFLQSFIIIFFFHLFFFKAQAQTVDISTATPNYWATFWSLENDIKEHADLNFEKPVIYKNDSRWVNQIFLPNDKPGPFPVVVVLPDCASVNEHNLEFMQKALKNGYASVVFDTHRGVKSNCNNNKLRPVKFGRQIKDLYDLATFLTTLPNIDKNRIYSVGGSEGGKINGFLASPGIKKLTAPNAPRYRANASLYAGSVIPKGSNPMYTKDQFYIFTDMDRPLLWLMGELDNEAFTTNGSDLHAVKELEKRKLPIEYHLFKDAYHCWDCKNKDGKTNTFTYFGSPVVVKYKFDEKIRDESYDRVMNFFDKHK